jgi:hypothetical protein
LLGRPNCCFFRLNAVKLKASSEEYEDLCLIRAFFQHYLVQNGAGKGIRTLDPRLGKPMLYQLSYSRTYLNNYRPLPELRKKYSKWWREKDSNLRKLALPDLQSGPFGHLGISPSRSFTPAFSSSRIKMELEKGFEPATCGLQNRCSTN